jgi:hypothetical protein
LIARITLVYSEMTRNILLFLDFVTAALFCRVSQVCEDCLLGGFHSNRHDLYFQRATNLL